MIDKNKLIAILLVLIALLNPHSVTANGCKHCPHLQQGIPGPTGPIGPTGESGPQGNPGTTTILTAYGSFSLEGSQPIGSDTPIPFNAAPSAALNITSDGAGLITVAIPGDYLITYSYSILTIDEAPRTFTNFGIYINGSVLGRTITTVHLTNSPGGPDDLYFETSSYIISIGFFNSIIEVRNFGANAVTVGTTDGTSTSAYITFVRLGDST